MKLIANPSLKTHNMTNKQKWTTSTIQFHKIHIAYLCNMTGLCRMIDHRPINHIPFLICMTQKSKSEIQTCSNDIYSCTASSWTLPIHIFIFPLYICNIEKRIRRRLGLLHLYQSRFTLNLICYPGTWC